MLEQGVNWLSSQASSAASWGSTWWGETACANAFVQEWIGYCPPPQSSICDAMPEIFQSVCKASVDAFGPYVMPAVETSLQWASQSYVHSAAVTMSDALGISPLAVYCIAAAAGGYGIWRATRTNHDIDPKTYLQNQESIMESLFRIEGKLDKQSKIETALEQMKAQMEQTTALVNVLAGEFDRLNQNDYAEQFEDIKVELQSYQAQLIELSEKLDTMTPKEQIQEIDKVKKARAQLEGYLKQKGVADIFYGDLLHQMGQEIKEGKFKFNDHAQLWQKEERRLNANLAKRGGAAYQRHKDSQDSVFNQEQSEPNQHQQLMAEIKKKKAKK